MSRRVGFIGLGNMGSGMCASFIRHGNDVVCFDTVPEAMVRFEGSARLAKNISEVVSESDFIFMMLPNSDVVESVVEEILSNDIKDKIIVDCSTSYPPSTKKLAQKIAQAGGKMVDAGMLAGPEEAESGDLIAVVGGDKDDIARIEPLLLQITKSYKYFGPSGSGHLMKIGVNFCSMTEATIFAQVYPILKKYGIEEELAYEGLNNEIFDNWVFQFYSKRYVSHDYWCGFSLDNGIKDMSYMKRLFDEQNIPGFILDGALTLARVTRMQQTPDDKLEMAHIARTMYQLLGYDE